jgi:hypothetical protein
MTEYNKTVPKNPTDSDATLEAVLEAILLYTEDGDEFVRYKNESKQVVLTFDGT